MFTCVTVYTRIKIPFFFTRQASMSVRVIRVHLNWTFSEDIEDFGTRMEKKMERKLTPTVIDGSELECVTMFRSLAKLAWWTDRGGVGSLSGG
jgi:hypothetical protein